MTEPEIRTITATLQARLAAITNNASKREGIVIQQAADTFDVVQMSAERDLTVSLLNNETALLRDLKAALRSVESGSYGICVQCEEEINPKRLAAVPCGLATIRSQ
jgi:DnaK suppressor protein